MVGLHLLLGSRRITGRTHERRLAERTYITRSATKKSGQQSLSFSNDSIAIQHISAGLAMETFGVTPVRQLSLMLIDWLVIALFDGGVSIP